MKGTLYILQSQSTGRYYVGSTTNLEYRLKQHHAGHTHTTRRLANFIVVFSQEFPSITLARKAERQIKRWKRKEYIEKIVREGKIRYTGL